jgi:hypothetical protein
MLLKSDGERSSHALLLGRKATTLLRFVVGKREELQRFARDRHQKEYFLCRPLKMADTKKALFFVLAALSI